MQNWYRFYRAERISKSHGARFDHEMPLIEIPQTFPWRWINMTAPLAAFIDERPSSRGAMAHLWATDTKAQARCWFDLAREHHPLDRVPTEVAASYRDWMIELDAAGTKIPVEHPGEKVPSPERSWRLDLERTFERLLGRLGRIELDSVMHHLRHADISDLPSEVIEADNNIVRYQRSFCELTSNAIEAPSLDRMFGAFWSGDSRAMEDTSRILLLDLPLGYPGGGYGVRFMIAPEDLAAGRFEKAEAIVEW